MLLHNYDIHVIMSFNYTDCCEYHIKQPKPQLSIHTKKDYTSADESRTLNGSLFQYSFPDEFRKWQLKTYFSQYWVTTAKKRQSMNRRESFDDEPIKTFKSETVT